MLCGFSADAGLVASFFTTGAAGFVAATVVDSDGLGFAFGAVISLLTRTDAGTMAVSSGMCCASGLLTTVGAADLTYDGLCGAGSLFTA